MKIISWNINGIRALGKSDFSAWLKKINADFICFQEIRADEKQVAEILAKENLLTSLNYNLYCHSAKKKGYSGVAILAKEKPLAVKRILGLKRFEDEGRILEFYYSEFVLINIYLPHGGRGKENMAYKLEVYDRLLRHFKKIKNKNIILVGDFNVARQEIDLARPKANLKNTMFTPEERSRIDGLIDLGFVDSFRQFNASGGYYTWWPYFANARQRNLGWRIDYIFVSKSIAFKLKNAYIFSDTLGSDHCPIGVEIF